MRLVCGLSLLFAVLGGLGCSFDVPKLKTHPDGTNPLPGDGDNGDGDGVPQGASCHLRTGWFDSGQSVPSNDCNLCWCNDGTLLCSKRDCSAKAPKASCIVLGHEYPDSRQLVVPDPYSCNSCECDDGWADLCEQGFWENCTRGCSKSTKKAYSCARCKNGGCEAMETGCFKPCATHDDCKDPAQPSCIDGACRNFCTDSDADGGTKDSAKLLP